MHSVLLPWIAGAAAIAIVILFRAAPRLSYVTWALVVFFVPIWVSYHAYIDLAAVMLVTIFCLASASLRGFRWGRVDWAILVISMLIVVSFAFGGINLGLLLKAVISWILPYAWGRLILGRLSRDFITSTIAAFTIAAAALAIVEFLTGVNFFSSIHIENAQYDLWSPLQPRGGFLRAEGAFGHSIALGACLSIGSVFILPTKWPLWIRITGLVVVGSAVVVTFSRIGLVAFALGLVLSIVFLGGALSVRTRTAVSALVITGALVAVPFVSEVFSAAGDEAQGSARYRLDLLSLVFHMSPLGLSSSYAELPNGQVYLGNFQSIDSAYILVGLSYGLIPLVLFLALLIAALFALFRGRANSAIIAVVAQIPTLATVALITQLPYVLFFVAGLAASLYILDTKPARAATTGGMKRAPLPKGEWITHG